MLCLHFLADHALAKQDTQSTQPTVLCMGRIVGETFGLAPPVQDFSSGSPAMRWQTSEQHARLRNSQPRNCHLHKCLFRVSNDNLPREWR